MQTDDQILVDFHTHPGHKVKKKQMLETLCSDGIVGIAKYENEDYLRMSYEDVLKQLKDYITQIEPGFAKVTSEYGTGYILRVQELESSTFHVLALGLKDKPYIRESKDPIQNIENIHKQGAIAVLVHPFLIRRPNERNPIIISSKYPEDLKLLHKCIKLVDNMEIFNGYCIDFKLAGYKFAQCNELSKDAAKLFGFKGTSGSDTHEDWKQIKTSGIYLDRQKALSGQDEIMSMIKNNQFENNYQNSINEFRAYWNRLRRYI